MKVSLNWIFDHIDGNVNKIDVVDLVNKFIKTTAEIEECRKVSFNVDQFTLVQVTHISDVVTVHSPEFKKDYTLALRNDAIVDFWYLIEFKNDTCIWACSNSVGGTKDMQLPALFVKEHLRSGKWKQNIEKNDYIIHIDNKSINHRPDLWGHRGIAREIAAILDLPLKPLSNFITHNKNSASFEQKKTGPFLIDVEASDVCQRFSALYVESIQNQSSCLTMVIRLSRIDNKAIDFIIDCTNYVMFDIGQPMHAFDAQLLKDTAISVRRAHNKEKLILLDGETIELIPQDIVIANDNSVVSLAGIMGGAKTSISQKTHSLLLEAAHFDAATIRRTAARYKKRTEASMRFEKNLDPNHNMDAITRFLFLLDQHDIKYKTNNELVTVGKDNFPVTIHVMHARIEQLLGMTITTDQVQSILKKLSFCVEKIINNNEIWYIITFPSFRVTKDKAIAEDIIEEIGRYVGYDSIPPVMPSLHYVPSDLHKTYTIRTIKKLLSNGLLMRELYGYSFFDESFLREIAWNPSACVDIKNPISENYTRLVSTLQPHLLKAIKDNNVHHTQLRFYEWGRQWHMDNDTIIEKKSLGGIFFEHNKSLDFYEGKNLLFRLFQTLKCDIAWQRTEHNQFPWLSHYQSAVIMHNGKSIGIAGMVEEAVINMLSAVEGSAFIFECDGDFLLDYKHSAMHFVPLAKYPAVYRDVSMIVPLSITVDTIISLIKNVDDRIKTVILIDFFAKDEWKDKKSLTFHVEIRDEHKTLEHEEVEIIWNEVITIVQQQGAIIR